jgi:hypothetical protein
MDPDLNLWPSVRKPNALPLVLLCRLYPTDFSNISFRCRFGLTKCSAENFTTRVTDFGVCYTFNDGEGGAKILETSNKGKFWQTLKQGLLPAAIFRMNHDCHGTATFYVVRYSCDVMLY